VVIVTVNADRAATTGMSVRCHDAIDDVDADDWRLLTQDVDIEFSPGYLRYLESQEGAARPVVVVRDGRGVPLAACCLAEAGSGTPFSSKPAYLLTDPHELHLEEDTAQDDEVLRNVLDRHGIDRAAGDRATLLGRLRHALLELAGVPIVVRNLWDSRLLAVAGLDRATRRRALAHTVQAVKREAVRRGYGSVAFVCTPGDDVELTGMLRAAGFQGALLRCLPELDLRGCATFEDYLARFRSHARHTMRSEIRRFKRAGLTIRVVDHDAFLPKLAAMEAANSRKYGGQLTEEILTSVHTDLQRYLGDRIVALGVLRGGEIVASVVILRGYRRLCGLIYGADYAHDRLPGAYAAALCYEPVRYALANGLESIGFGFGSYEAKIARGGRLRERHLYIWTARPEGAALLGDWLPIVDSRSRRFFDDLRGRYQHRVID
jgi:predicted N-acyltransferase